MEGIKLTLMDSTLFLPSSRKWIGFRHLVYENLLRRISTFTCLRRKFIPWNFQWFYSQVTWFQEQYEHQPVTFVGYLYQSSKMPGRQALQRCDWKLDFKSLECLVISSNQILDAILIDNELVDNREWS